MTAPTAYACTKVAATFAKSTSEAEGLRGLNFTLSMANEVGEARGGEALDMLQAMNTVHDGSLTTIHSNSPRDTLRRIEAMVLMAGMELPLHAIRERITSAIDLVVHLDRLRDGTRKVVKVSEVQGVEGMSIVMRDLFFFKQPGMQSGRVIESLNSTGLRPKFVDKFAENNIELPEEVFSSPDSSTSQYPL